MWLHNADVDEDEGPTMACSVWLVPASERRGRALARVAARTGRSG